jgi:hypothetical protein
VVRECRPVPPCSHRRHRRRHRPPRLIVARWVAQLSSAQVYRCFPLRAAASHALHLVTIWRRARVGHVPVLHGFGAHSLRSAASILPLHSKNSASKDTVGAQFHCVRDVGGILCGRLSRFRVQSTHKSVSLAPYVRKGWRSLAVSTLTSHVQILRDSHVALAAWMCRSSDRPIEFMQQKLLLRSHNFPQSATGSVARVAV